jgi:Glucodextranase, domain B
MYESQANVSIISMVNTGSREVQISGTATQGARVTANGEPVAVRPDGTWSVALRVGHGPTVVNVVAVSADGSSRSSSSVTASG